LTAVLFFLITIWLVLVVLVLEISPQFSICLFNSGKPVIESLAVKPALNSVIHGGLEGLAFHETQQLFPKEVSADFLEASTRACVAIQSAKDGAKTLEGTAIVETRALSGQRQQIDVIIARAGLVRAWKRTRIPLRSHVWQARASPSIFSVSVHLIFLLSSSLGLLSLLVLCLGGFLLCAHCL